MHQYCLQHPYYPYREKIEAVGAVLNRHASILFTTSIVVNNNQIILWGNEHSSQVTITGILLACAAPQWVNCCLVMGLGCSDNQSMYCGSEPSSS